MNYKVTFLFDPLNDWIEAFLDSERRIFDINGFDFEVSKRHEVVRDQDLVFILGYTKILGGDFLLSNRLNLVVHESDLPNGKGFAPVQWQLLEGKTEIPICLIEATEQVDSGDILCRSSFEILKTDLYEDIRAKQAKASFDLIFRFLSAYPNLEREKQTGDGHFYRRRTAKDNELDPALSIEEQFNILRIGNNEDWPSYFFIDGKKFILKIYTED